MSVLGPQNRAFSVLAEAASCSPQHAGQAPGESGFSRCLFQPRASSSYTVGQLELQTEILGAGRPQQGAGRQNGKNVAVLPFSEERTVRCGSSRVTYFLGASTSFFLKRG